jgi:hypothetical protein
MWESDEWLGVSDAARGPQRSPSSSNRDRSRPVEVPHRTPGSGSQVGRGKARDELQLVVGKDRPATRAVVDPI